MENEGVQYLDGTRFRVAFLAGADALSKDRDYLNKINVFPVPDADTGTNMTTTVMAIANELPDDENLSVVLDAAAKTGLSFSRGNSGIIFAQFMYSLAQELSEQSKVATDRFAKAVTASSVNIYQSLSNPVEGTILSLIKDWAASVTKHAKSSTDFGHVLRRSLKAAQQSLADTPKKLKVLADAGVVDAGAKGFVDFLTGIVEFIADGNLRKVPKALKLAPVSDEHLLDSKEDIEYRYCTEALITDSTADFITIKREAAKFGNSIVVAGSPERLRLHAHTNEPAELFAWLRLNGTVSGIKADDMLKQYEVSHERKWPIAIVTDSTCDLPEEFLQKYQIQVISYQLSFGDNMYLDKITVRPDTFYDLQEQETQHPQTGVPGLKSVDDLYSFLGTYYDSIISIHIADKLSGMMKLAHQAAAKCEPGKVHVIDSRGLSVSLALIVARIAKSIEAGIPVDDIIRLTHDWIKKTKVYVDIDTLKYLVRSGRVSPTKGKIAKLLNLKPIVTIDEEGGATAFGKSFSRKASMEKIINILRDFSKEHNVWNYGIVHARDHERAEQYAEQLKKILRKPPLFIEYVSPVVGAHNGIGTIGVAIMAD